MFVTLYMEFLYNLVHRVAPVAERILRNPFLRGTGGHNRLKHQGCENRLAFYLCITIIPFIIVLIIIVPANPWSCRSRPSCPVANRRRAQCHQASGNSRYTVPQPIGRFLMQGFRLLTAVCAVSMSLIAANNPFIGTWKLDASKSQFAPGTETKDLTMTFEAVGDQVKRVATGTDPDGKPINENSTIRWDGKDHSIDQPGMTVAVSSVNDRTIRFTVKQQGNVVLSGRAAVSENGNTMTASEKGEDPKGRAVDNRYVFEKQ